MTDRIERVLVVMAHPDDAEFGAGGTVGKLVKQGAEVTYVVVTNGSMGSSDRAMSRERLAGIPARLRPPRSWTGLRPAVAAERSASC
jgi:LmbE family N-acetylglucosaminyl deacetylase